MHVTELVPQVSLVQRRRVAAAQQLRPGECLKHEQMRGPRLVEAGEEPVHRAQRAPRRHDQLGPPSRGDDVVLAATWTAAAGICAGPLTAAGILAAAETSA